MILTFPTDYKDRCLFDPLSLKPRLVMARPTDICGRDGGGAAEGSPEKNILWEVPPCRPSIYLRLIRIVLLAIAVLVVSVVLFSVLDPGR